MPTHTSRVARTSNPDLSASSPGIDSSVADRVEAQGPRRLSVAWLMPRLKSRHATWVVIALGLLLTSTSLTLGLTGDDHLHALMLREHPGLQGMKHHTLDLFAFASGDPAETHGMVQEGVFPWWTDPQIKIAFFRPLSSLTHWVDHTLWPNQPFLIHLHSMAWLFLLLASLSLVYRRFFSARAPWLAALALLLYAVDDARAAPVGWIANRNAMIAAIPALLALLAHDRARKEGSRSAKVLAPFLLTLGLLAGEAGVQMVGYLVAYAVFLDPASRKQRVWSLVPYVGLVVAWRALYVLLGYGAHGSGLYLDPAGHPLSFLEGLVTRLPVLLLAEFALPWSEFWDLAPVLAPWIRPGMLLLAAVVVGGLVVLLRPLWKADPTVRFWALGTLLATIPACAAVPNDRLLTATGIGGAALLAHLLGSLADGSYPKHGRGVVYLCEALVFIHLLFAPFTLPFRTKAIDGLELVVAHADRSIPSTPDVANREVVVLNPPVDPLAIYFPAYREARNIPRPHYFRWLATGICDLSVERRDAYTLRLRPRDGYLSNSSQWMLRDPKTPSHVGEQVVLDDATFTITQVTTDRRPAEVDVRFHEPLESSHFQFLQWGVHEYVPFRLPAVGQRVLIPAVDMKKALFGLGISDA